MPLTIVARETLHVGQPLVVDGDSPIGRYATVFEDDGNTGYFYAIDTDVEDGNPILPSVVGLADDGRLAKAFARSIL